MSNERSRRLRSEDREQTFRWVGVSVVAFAAASVGVLLRRPPMLLVAVVGVSYLAYVQSASRPDPDLAIERRIEDETPRPDEDVRVTLEVTNEGDATLPDLRLVDGVPPRLKVTDDTARLGTALRPGESATHTYTVESRRGTHEFGPTQVVARDWTGAIEVDAEQTVEGSVTAVPELEALDVFPLRRQTVESTGQIRTRQGGSGVEFHATREYRPGDPMKRIDWNRKASTGELTTIEFIEERAARAVMVIDTRDINHVGDIDNESAVDHSVRAAGRTAAALLETDTPVGLAAYGPEWDWLEPGLGRTHEARLTERFGFSPAFSPTESEETFYPVVAFRRLRKHLPNNAQVVFFTAALDDYSAFIARRLERYGHATTVVSPDVTDASTPGGALAMLERENRLREARNVGIRVVDWEPDSSLRVAIERARRGWR